MTRKIPIKLTANFERNLEAIYVFLAEAEAVRAYDCLLDELLNTLIPNLGRFPAMGRRFFERPVRSVEVASSLEQLRARLQDSQRIENGLREYLLADYLVLYVQLDNVIHLLAIKHHRQLSFDFQSLWSVD